MKMMFLSVIVVIGAMHCKTAAAQEKHASVCDGNGFISWVGGGGILDNSTERFSVVAAFGKEAKCTYDLQLPACFRATQERLVSVVQMDLVDESCGQEIFSSIIEGESQRLVRSIAGVRLQVLYRVKSGWAASSFEDIDGGVGETRKFVESAKQVCALGNLSDEEFLIEVQKKCVGAKERRKAACKQEVERQRGLGMESLDPNGPFPIQCDE